MKKLIGILCISVLTACAVPTEGAGSSDDVSGKGDFGLPEGDARPETPRWDLIDMDLDVAPEPDLGCGTSNNMEVGDRPCGAAYSVRNIQLTFENPETFDRFELRCDDLSTLCGIDGLVAAPAELFRRVGQIVETVIPSENPDQAVLDWAAQSSAGDRGR